MKGIRFFLTLTLLFSLYLIKALLGLDLFPDFHLSDYLPFRVPLVNAAMRVVEVKPDSIIIKNGTVIDVNGGGWQRLWARDSAAVRIAAREPLTIKSHSEQDWALAQDALIKVEAGQDFRFNGAISIDGAGSEASLSVVLYDKNQKVMLWNYARAAVSGNSKRSPVTKSFIIPKGAAFIQFRLNGRGKGEFIFEGVTLERGHNSAPNDSSKGLFACELENKSLHARWSNSDNLLVVIDKRIKTIWTVPLTQGFSVTKHLQNNSLMCTFQLFDPSSVHEYSIVLSLAPDAPEIRVSANAPHGGNFDKLNFPAFVHMQRDDAFVVPMQEGLFLNERDNADDFPQVLRHGGPWPMAFVGVLRGSAGAMHLVETPADHELVRSSNDGEFFYCSRWLSEKKRFGYERVVRFVFFPRADYVSMAKHYRNYFVQKGLVESLQKKNAKRNNNIQKLIGAVNVWYWGTDRAGFAEELRKEGITKVLFSNAEKASDVLRIDALGFLSSRYDIYQDVWDPALAYVTKQHAGWPDDIVFNEKGEWIKGWSIKKDGKEYPGGVICSIPGLQRARTAVARELKQSPYTARFIDATTSTLWRECYNPAHPTTRSSDIEHKIALLSFMSNDLHLVTGSEDGVDLAASSVDYFEGLMSIGFARLPESGRNVAQVRYMNPTSRFLKYQVGEKYRIPLWRLVLGDSVVSTWYWGDASNRIPEVWWRRDLLNILYGNMPLWAIRDYAHWQQLKAKFISSYKNVAPVFEKVGYEEMLSHRFLTYDRTVQETVFTGDVRIVVNFGEKSFALAGSSYIVQPRGFAVFEKGKLWKSGVAS